MPPCGANGDQPGRSHHDQDGVARPEDRGLLGVEGAGGFTPAAPINSPRIRDPNRFFGCVLNAFVFHQAAQILY